MKLSDGSTCPLRAARRNCLRCLNGDCSPAVCPEHPDAEEWRKSEAYRLLRSYITKAGRRLYPAGGSA